MRSKQIVRVKREQLATLADDVAARIALLAETGLPAHESDVQLRMRLAASTIKAAGKFDGGIDRRNTLELVVLTLADCMALAATELSRSYPEKHQTWKDYVESVRWARYAVTDLRDVTTLVNTAEASERAVQEGTPDEEMPEGVGYDWNQAVQCLARLTVFIGER